MQVGAVDGTLATAEALVVAGNLDPGVVDADLVAATSSRSNRTSGTSPVVPCTLVSATSRIHQARCASSAAQEAKHRPAMALCLT